MECPCCDDELTWEDYFNQYGKKRGDIYRCENEECDHYQHNFYTYDGNGEVYEGYPC